MSFQVGDTVGDYQIIGLLGAGGMGKVYKVKNTDLRPHRCLEGLVAQSCR